MSEIRKFAELEYKLDIITTIIVVSALINIGLMIIVLDLLTDILLYK